MYRPTESEKCDCIRIVKDILGIDNDFVCKRYIDNIFSTAYSIGGDYSEKTLRSIAEVILKDVQVSDG